MPANQMPNDLLAIDLSSERVRLATWLLDGVRQGQPLGALLGYRFERRLAGSRKAAVHFVLPRTRAAGGAEAGAPNRPIEPVEAIAANNVVDGLAVAAALAESARALRRRNGPARLFLLGNRSVTEQAAAGRPDNADFKAASKLNLTSLEDAVDAVSDALMAESVYQVVRGNPLRAASTVESIAGGETPPPELEVVRTPRTGIALTHRLVTLVQRRSACFRPNGRRPSNPFRANAEPHLNAWAAKLLGNPANVRCVVERLEPATGKVLESKELRLNQLRLAPLDFIYAVEGGQGGQQAEIEQRILYTIMRKPDGFAPGSLLRINPNRKPEWKTDELGYGEFSELLRTARKLITGVRGIDAERFEPAGAKHGFQRGCCRVGKTRGRRRSSRCAGLRNDFQAQLAAPDTANLEVLRDLILRSAGFGVAGAVPLSAAGDSPADRQTLLAQAGSIQKELAQRVEQLTALAAGFNAGTATLEEQARSRAGAAAHRLRQGVRRAAAFHGGERRGA